MVFAESLEYLAGCKVAVAYTVYCPTRASIAMSGCKADQKTLLMHVQSMARNRTLTQVSEPA